jgi:hypothetical protein
VLVGVVALVGMLEASAIEWDAPTPPCPTLSAVEDSVRAMAGRLPEADEVRARALVVQSGEGWSLRLTTEVGGEAQERVLEAESCDALAKATAILIAVAVDPIATAHEVRSTEEIVTPPPEPPPRVESAEPIDPIAVAPRVSGPPPRRRVPVRMHLGIGGGVIVGAVPGVTGGPVATLGLTRGKLRAELRGAWWAPRVGRSGPASARVQVGTVAAVVCGEPGNDAVTFPLCGGVEAGALRGRGVQVPNAHVEHFAWIAALLAAGVRAWVRPRVGLRADLEVAVPLGIYRVFVGSQLVHETAAVGARGLAGVEFRLR